MSAGISTAARTVVTATQKAAAAYTAVPDWVGALALEIDGASRIKDVADRLGYAPSTLSGVINNSYTGRLVHVENAVRRTLMRDKVDCPVLGAITGEACETHQRRETVPATNPQRVRLYRMCNSGRCPFSGAAEELSP